ncbi:MAG: hypothetical protein ACTSO2_19995 [Promethearchaeota archaeon]
MKINLTKLLERSKIKELEDLNKRNTSAAYHVRAIQDCTSTESAYSFELEKEEFTLKK